MCDRRGPWRAAAHGLFDGGSERLGAVLIEQLGYPCCLGPEPLLARDELGVQDLGLRYLIEEARAALRALLAAALLGEVCEMRRHLDDGASGPRPDVLGDDLALEEHAHPLVACGEGEWLTDEARRDRVEVGVVAN